MHTAPSPCGDVRTHCRRCGRKGSNPESYDFLPLAISMRVTLAHVGGGLPGVPLLPTGRRLLGLLGREHVRKVQFQV